MEDDSHDENFNLLEHNEEKKKQASERGFSGPVYANGVTVMETPKDISVPVMEDLQESDSNSSEVYDKEAKTEALSEAGEETDTKEVEVKQDMNSEIAKEVLGDEVIGYNNETITTGKPEKMSKQKIWLIAGTSAAILLLGGGTAFGLVKYFNSPERILKTAMENLMRAKSVTIDTNVKTESEGEMGSMLDAMQFENTTTVQTGVIWSEQKIALDTGGGQKMDVNVQIGINETGKIALQVKGLEKIVEQYGEMAGTELKTAAEEITKRLSMETWAIEPIKIAKQFNLTDNNELKASEALYQCAVQTGVNMDKYKQDLTKMMMETMEIKSVKTEKDQNVYDLSIKKDKLAQAEKKLATGEMMKDYAKCLKAQGGVADTLRSVEKKLQGAETMGDSEKAEDLKRVLENVQLKVNKKTKTIETVTLKGEEKGQKWQLESKLKLNKKEMELKQRFDEAKPIDSLVTDIMKAIQKFKEEEE